MVLAPLTRAVELPTALVATTLNVYDVPLVRPVTVQVNVLVEQVWPPTPLAVTV